MKIKQLRKIELSESTTLIDIGVADDHTFYVSDKPHANYVLTHNSFPDIDSDFGDRKLALKLIADFFGEENVIPVSNFAQLQLASLCKDLARIFDVPFELVNTYTGKMRAEAMAVARREPGFDAQSWEFTLEVAREDSPSFNLFMKEMEAYPEFKSALEVLFKQQRTVSRHAGGVIITDNTRENMPLIKAKGGLQTPWAEGLNGRYLEDLGFLKFDILGLGTLRMFEECIRKILVRHKGIKYPTFDQIRRYFDTELHPDNNAMDDQQVFENVFHKSNYAGVFQFVQKNTQSFMARMKPTSVLDIAIATSIFRPGPMGLDLVMQDGKKVRGAHNVYLQNRASPDSIKYEHPIMQEVLGPTAGLLIFQEQLQLLVHKLAGWHLDDTDAVRKAFTKKDKANQAKLDKERDELRVQFVAGAKTHSGMTEEAANAVWSDFEKWTAYGFNKTLLDTTLVTTYTKAGEFVETKEIKDIGAGEFLRSRDETTQEEIFVEVVERHDHGVLELFEFELDDGSKFTCTKDHKFRVADGRMLPVWMIMEQNLDIVVDKDNGSIS